ncbi:hypothetical protein N8I77_003651 [Diaporthe amygdali]|uniref:Uncharacterized protein n=1 Tax=Phomopsis amygdali TaxID=1214568 RepID=A0AAD9SKP2_PHOAM|nr:hypothetical protein N8I77_003651 [Diaporthe amygdali]
MAATSQAAATVYKPPESREGTVTSWIPLITPYSILPECTSALMRWDPSEAIIAYDPGFGISVDQRSQCGPKAVTAWWDQDRLGPNIETITSIGPLLTCPEPFIQMTTSVLDASSMLVGCCPSDYTFRTWKPPGSIGQCFSMVSPGAVFTFYEGFSGWKKTNLSFSETSSIAAVHVNGWTFAEETGEPGSPGPAESTCAPGNGALGNGDIIGIGVGAAMGCIGVMTLAAGLIMMRRSRRARRTPITTLSTIEAPKVTSVWREGRYGRRSGLDAGSLHQRHELDQGPPGELHGDDPYTNGVPTELESRN